MANEQNLIGHQFTSEQSREEAAINGRKGGIASGEAKRKRKSLKEALIFLLNDTHSIKNKDTGEIKEMLGTDALATALYSKAVKGNTKAFELIRDTIGEKPVEKVELNQIDREQSLKELQELFDDTDGTENTKTD